MEERKKDTTSAHTRAHIQTYYTIPLLVAFGRLFGIFGRRSRRKSAGESDVTTWGPRMSGVTLLSTFNELPKRSSGLVSQSSVKRDSLPHHVWSAKTTVAWLWHRARGSEIDRREEEGGIRQQGGIRRGKKNDEDNGRQGEYHVNIAEEGGGRGGRRLSRVSGTPRRALLHI